MNGSNLCSEAGGSAWNAGCPGRSCVYLSTALLADWALVCSSIHHCELRRLRSGVTSSFVPRPHSASVCSSTLQVLILADEDLEDSVTAADSRSLATLLLIRDIQVIISLPQSRLRSQAQRIPASRLTSTSLGFSRQRSPLSAPVDCHDPTIDLSHWPLQVP